MEDFTRDELREALRAIESTLGKCEKVLPKLRQGTPQHTLTVRRVRALEIAAALIAREWGGEGRCPVSCARPWAT